MEQKYEHPISIEFGVFDPAEIKKMSVVSIKNSVAYTGCLPQPFGVNDHR